jgi:hypothetical protein
MYKVGNFKIREKASQWNRYEDMLKDEPKTAALKHLRNIKTVTGRTIKVN